MAGRLLDNLSFERSAPCHPGIENPDTWFFIIFIQNLAYSAVEYYQ